MAKHDRHIPKSVKEYLIAECQEKCANPGCSNTRLQIHHIKHWAVYKTHDKQHMIALCPTCHDACHHGKLMISDENLYNWKHITRASNKIHSQIYVEPGSVSKLLTGSFALAPKKKQKVIVIQISETNKLEFSLDGAWLNINATISDNQGNVVLEVRHNRLTLNKDEDFSLTQIPGKITVSVPADKFYLPAYALFKMRQEEPVFASDDKVIVLDLEVIKPGHVQVQGFWENQNNTIIITKNAIYFCGLHDEQPYALAGHGEDTVIHFSGPVTSALFKYG